MFGLAKKLVSTIENQASNYLSNGVSNINNRPGVDLTDGVGLRVLHVEKGSLGEKYGFESWFDFITAVNGKPIETFFRKGTALNSNPYSGMNPGEQPQVQSVELQQQFDKINIDPVNVDFSLFLDFLNSVINVYHDDLIFTVWSAKGGVERQITIPNGLLHLERKSQLEEVSLSPQTSRNNQKPVTCSSLKNIQISLQLTVLSASSFVWHILHVQPNSPAFVAGIMPDEYIIDCENGKLSTGGEDLLGRVIVAAYNRWKLQSTNSNDAEPCSLVLYVYNHDYDIIRPVTIYPNEHWGGRGLLGCDIGYGLLHRIPEVLGKFAAGKASSPPPNFAPGSVMFNQKNQLNGNPDQNKDAIPSNSTLLPATEKLLRPAARAPLFSNSQVSLDDANTATKPPLPPVKSPRKVRHKSKSKSDKSRASALEDYFKEETEKSRAIDGPSAISKTSSGAVPPPPRIGTRKTEEK
ncbi:hypothetical protein BRETT_001534 [Brettanomyces bruxellensis]|uniref:PDZ GRASP-type domain-containing protein n=1 Tax=Dekkera bruxellensis TaxID=5007 RepID=A0A871R7K0_DEKBR|nr:uncharacterized protein BRETT_001534 [Brettanomyces bruxellensis]QOU18090.1 hypothetical protein BRETT_001534 [Brettanomyces bruxellensis]